MHRIGYGDGKRLIFNAGKYCTARTLHAGYAASDLKEVWGKRKVKALVKRQGTGPCRSPRRRRARAAASGQARRPDTHHRVRRVLHDIVVRNGTLKAGVELPVIPGHEIAGVVEEMGTLVTYIKPGERRNDAALPRVRQVRARGGLETLCRELRYLGDRGRVGG